LIDIDQTRIKVGTTGAISLGPERKRAEAHFNQKLKTFVLLEIYVAFFYVVCKIMMRFFIIG
jgi:hypothetical protein